MGNTSLCLIKLERHKEAKNYLEIMLTHGNQKLKFYLRLAACYETLDHLDKAKNVLENRSIGSLNKETDEFFIRKHTQMLKSIKLKIKQEEAKQNELFMKSIITTTNKKSNITDPWYMRLLGYAFKFGGSALVGVVSTYLCQRFFGDINSELAKGVGFTNFGLSFMLLANFKRKERESCIVNCMSVLFVNLFWIQTLRNLKD